MKDEKELEDKNFRPSFNKKVVKVRINQNRAISGVGKAGDVVEMTEQDAEKYAQMGFVTILNKEK